MNSSDSEQSTPWSIDANEVASRAKVNLETGLTAAEVTRRQEQFGPNELVGQAPTPWWVKLLAQVRDPLTYLLFGAVVLSLVAWWLEDEGGLPLEAIVIGIIIVANATLGFIEENKAEKAVAALQRLTAATANVLRDGTPTRIDARDIVPGDILILNEGDAVAADARLVSSANLKVMEASLTGESEPVLKQVGEVPADAALAERANMVYKGTAISTGVGRAVVTHIGSATEVGHIAHLLDTTAADPSPLEREIARVGKTLGIGVIVIAIVVVGTLLFINPPKSLGDAVDALLLGVSLAVAAVPEGLPAVLSVVLAVGVQRMAKERAIVKKLASVETLGCTSVICSDKTGTLTQNQMTVQRVVTVSGELTVSGVGYAPNGEFKSQDGVAPSGPLETETALLLRYAARASNAALVQNGEDYDINGDPTEGALVVAERKWAKRGEVAPKYTRRGEIPFTSDRKLMSVVVQNDAETTAAGELILITKGAPDVLLGLCTHEHANEAAQPLSEERSAAITSHIETLTDHALRPLAVAYRHLTDAEKAHVSSGKPLPADLEQGLTYLGLIGMLDPAREEVAGAIAEAKAAGIRVIMITGDHPRTAERIAEHLGLVDAAESNQTSAHPRVLTGPQFAKLDDNSITDVVRRVSVFARVAPEHKLQIVDALQAQGEIVAMTGDGVNDAPALKSADIGIAMGITGTDVSKEAAKIILADDNFATIVAAIREGRLIFHNISGFLRYLLSSNTGEVCTVFFGVIGARLLGFLDHDGAPIAPLLATQILWINLLTDAAPALALGVDNVATNLMSRPPRAANARIIDRPMLTSVVFTGVVMGLCTLLTMDAYLPGGLIEGSRTVEEARSAAFTVLVLAQLFNCLNSRSHDASAFKGLFTNGWLWSALALSLALQVLVVYVPWLNIAFGTVPLTLDDWVVCLFVSSFVLIAGEIRKLFTRLTATQPPSHT
jgi:Ca2+-transporting ATPase